MKTLFNQEEGKEKPERYAKTCKRCGQVFMSKYKHGKICPTCKKK